MINDVKISGKIDRIIMNDNEVKIIDYKTGEPPTNPQVITGKKPQLIIYAYGLSKTLNQSQYIGEIIFWKLKINDYKPKSILNKQDEINLVLEVCEKQLQKIFDFYMSNKNYFFATNNIENDYFQNLTRIQEWKN